MKKNKKKIFIFGSAGEVGSDLVKYFSDDFRVYAFQRNKKNTNFNKKNITYVYHDFTKPLNFNINPDIIINCIVSHEFSKENSFSDLIKNNILTIQNILNFTKKKKSKFINLSSVVIFEQLNNKVLFENSSINDINLLGSLKLLIEKSIEYENIDCINLRLPGVLSLSNTFSRPWLKKMIINIKRNKTIKIYNKNTYFNNLITTREIFRFINFLLSQKIFYKGTYNFSSIKPIKVNNLIILIKSFYESSSIIEFSNIKKKTFIIENKKLIKKFGFKIFTTETMLNDYLNELKNL